MLSITSDDNTIADPAEQRIDIASNLQLEIGKSSFIQNALAEDSLSETTITSSTASNANLGVLQYQVATSATIGDYMQLQLVDTSIANQLFSTYS